MWPSATLLVSMRSQGLPKAQLYCHVWLLSNRTHREGSRASTAAQGHKTARVEIICEGDAGKCWVQPLMPSSTVHITQQCLQQ
jgi:hypothetical protein